jgi:hypothetical protein
MEAAEIMVGITKVDDISTIVPVRLEEVVWGIYSIYNNFLKDFHHQHL